MSATSQAVEPEKTYRRVMPLVRLDNRTRLARRIAELRANFTEALGGPSAIWPILATRISDAAELKAIAEKARADFLAGRSISLAHLIRIERRADTAVKALGIVERHEPTPTLADVLNGRAAK